MRVYCIRILLLLSYFIAVGFFGFYNFEVQNYDLIAFAVIPFSALIGLKAKKEVYRKFTPILIGVLAIAVVNILTSYYSYAQPFIYSLRAFRVFLIVLPLLFLTLEYLSLNSHQKELSPSFLTFVAVVLIFVHLIVITFNLPTIIPHVRVLERFGSLRFLIAPATVIFLTFYFYFESKKLFSLNSLLLGLLLVLIFYISKTRAIIIPIVFFFFITLIWKIYKKDIYPLVKVFIFTLLCVAIFHQPISNYFSSFTEYFEKDITAEDGNVSIRSEAFQYYLEQMTVEDFILGRGIENKLISTKYEERLTLSDIGFFKVVYYHGLFGAVLIVIFFVNFYRSANRSLPFHRAVKSFILFQLMASPTIIFIYSVEGLFVNLFLFSLVKNEK